MFKTILNNAAVWMYTRPESIRTVPGLNRDPMTAIVILSETGNGMSVFSSAKHLSLLG